jgi:pimeloyl-ACP methyl ester carboxylesterase
MPPGDGAPPVMTPRQPRVLGLCPDDPDAIFVEAIGGRMTQSELFKVSLSTGKFVSLHEERDEGRYLYDRQGRPRILETPHVRMPVGSGLGSRVVGNFGDGLAMMSSPVLQTQEFRYRAATAKRGWQDLDAVLGPGAAFVFHDDAKNYYGQRSFPLAFGADPEVLYFASNIGRDTYGIYALDLRAKRRTDFAVEIAGVDCADPEDALSASALVFERQGKLAGVRLSSQRPGARWFDAAMMRVQEKLDADFTGRRVEIVDWADNGSRVLVLVTGTADPGRYFIYEPGEPGRLTEFLRRAPWLKAEMLNASRDFAFETPAGGRLTGTLTLPRRSRGTPPPLVLFCRELPGTFERPGFNRDLVALADMGFAIAQVNYRGVAGFGAQHRDAAKAGFDRIPVEDLRAAVAWITSHHPVSAKRVALVGEGFGGFVALRAVQLFPQEFRAAVSINAPTDPAHWLKESPGAGPRGASMPSFEREVRRAFFDQPNLGEIAVVRHVAATQRPVFIIQDAERRDLGEARGRSLREVLKRQGLDAEFLETTPGFSRGEAGEQVEVFSKIGEFLNAHLYDFNVDVGEAKEVK